MYQFRFRVRVRVRVTWRERISTFFYVEVMVARVYVRTSTSYSRHGLVCRNNAGGVLELGVYGLTAVQSLATCFQRLAGRHGQGRTTCHTAQSHFIELNLIPIMFLQSTFQSLRQFYYIGNVRYSERLHRTGLWSPENRHRRLILLRCKRWLMVCLLPVAALRIFSSRSNKRLFLETAQESPSTDRSEVACFLKHCQYLEQTQRSSVS